jgi:hypothetical protein
MKTTTCRSRFWIAILAGALVAPAPLHAQADTLRTHVVQRGETLWSLAATYLGNGHRWREIVALNQALIRSAQDLPVGATIRIPQRAPSTATRTQPAPMRPAARDTMTVVSRDSAAPPAGAPPVAASPPQSRTIFFGAQPGGGFAQPARDSSGTRAVMDTALPPSLFESLSVPFVIDAGMLSTAGRCTSIDTGVESVVGAAPGGALLRSVITITPPAGVTRAGDRFILVRPAVELPGLGRVVIPTGVVRVTGPDAPIRAGVVAQFDIMSCDDRVVAPSVAEIPIDATPEPVASGASGRVVWVGGDALLPALAHSLIVDIGAAAAVRPGDRLTIFAEDNATEVAGAIVVRVDGPTASALITRRPAAGVVIGLPARVTAKLP